MPSLNKATIMGYLGRDPDIKNTASGNMFAVLSVATSKAWKDKSTGEKKTATEWHRAVVYNENLAEIVKKYLKKGSLVYLEGELKTRKWTDDSGQEKYTTEIILQGYNSHLLMLDSAKDDNHDQPDHADTPPAAPAAIDDMIPF